MFTSNEATPGAFAVGMYTPSPFVSEAVRLLRDLAGDVVWALVIVEAEAVPSGRPAVELVLDADTGGALVAAPEVGPMVVLAAEVTDEDVVCLGCGVMVAAGAAGGTDTSMGLEIVVRYGAI